MFDFSALGKERDKRLGAKPVGSGESDVSYVLSPSSPVEPPVESVESVEPLAEEAKDPEVEPEETEAPKDPLVELEVVEAVGGRRTPISIPLTHPILQLKLMVERALGLGVLEQRLRFGGRVLDDSRSLRSYGLTTGTRVHLERRLTGAVHGPTGGADGTAAASGGQSCAGPYVEVDLVGVDGQFLSLRLAKETTVHMVKKMLAKKLNDCEPRLIRIAFTSGNLAEKGLPDGKELGDLPSTLFFALGASEETEARPSPAHQPQSGPLEVGLTASGRLTLSLPSTSAPPMAATPRLFDAGFVGGPPEMDLTKGRDPRHAAPSRLRHTAKTVLSLSSPRAARAEATQRKAAELVLSATEKAAVAAEIQGRAEDLRKEPKTRGIFEEKLEKGQVGMKRMPFAREPLPEFQRLPASNMEVVSETAVERWLKQERRRRQPHQARRRPRRHAPPSTAAPTLRRPSKPHTARTPTKAQRAAKARSKRAAEAEKQRRKAEEAELPEVWADAEAFNKADTRVPHVAKPKPRRASNIAALRKAMAAEPQAPTAALPQLPRPQATDPALITVSIKGLLPKPLAVEVASEATVGELCDAVATRLRLKDSAALRLSRHSRPLHPDDLRLSQAGIRDGDAVEANVRLVGGAGDGFALAYPPGYHPERRVRVLNLPKDVTAAEVVGFLKDRRDAKGQPIPVLRDSALTPDSVIRSRYSVRPTNCEADVLLETAGEAVALAESYAAGVEAKEPWSLGGRHLDFLRVSDSPDSPALSHLARRKDLIDVRAGWTDLKCLAAQANVYISELDARVLAPSKTSQGNGKKKVKTDTVSAVIGNKRVYGSCRHHPTRSTLGKIQLNVLKNLTDTVRDELKAVEGLQGGGAEAAADGEAEAQRSPNDDLVPSDFAVEVLDEEVLDAFGLAEGRQLKARTLIGSRLAPAKHLAEAARKQMLEIPELAETARALRDAMDVVDGELDDLVVRTRAPKSRRGDPNPAKAKEYFFVPELLNAPLEAQPAVKDQRNVLASITSLLAMYAWLQYAFFVALQRPTSAIDLLDKVRKAVEELVRPKEEGSVARLAALIAPAPAQPTADVPSDASDSGPLADFSDEPAANLPEPTANLPEASVSADAVVTDPAEAPAAAEVNEQRGEETVEGGAEQDVRLSWPAEDTESGLRAAVLAHFRSLRDRSRVSEQGDRDAWRDQENDLVLDPELTKDMATRQSKITQIIDELEALKRLTRKFQRAEWTEPMEEEWRSFRAVWIPASPSPADGFAFADELAKLRKFTPYEYEFRARESLQCYCRKCLMVEEPIFVRRAGLALEQGDETSLGSALAVLGGSDDARYALKAGAGGMIKRCTCQNADRDSLGARPTSLVTQHRSITSFERLFAIDVQPRQSSGDMPLSVPLILVPTAALPKTLKAESSTSSFKLRTLVLRTKADPLLSSHLLLSVDWAAGEPVGRAVWAGKAVSLDPATLDALLADPNSAFLSGGPAEMPAPPLPFHRHFSSEVVGWDAEGEAVERHVVDRRMGAQPLIPVYASYASAMDEPALSLQLVDQAQLPQPIDGRPMLGEGGFGKVYEVPSADGPAALKQSKAQPEFVNEFAELRALQALATAEGEGKAFVCGAIQAFVVAEEDPDVAADGIPRPEHLLLALLLPKADASLDRFVDQEGYLAKGNGRLERLVAQTAKGLRFLHDQCRLVHLDLKEPNVLVFGEDFALADLGLSLEMGRTADWAMTRGGAGTLLYRAPELNGSELVRVGPPADVFGWAQTLLACLNGIPFQAPILSRMAKAKEGIRKLKINMPICERMMEREREMIRQLEGMQRDMGAEEEGMEPGDEQLAEIRQQRQKLQADLDGRRRDYRRAQERQAKRADDLEDLKAKLHNASEDANAEDCRVQMEFLRTVEKGGWDGRWSMPVSGELKSLLRRSLSLRPETRPGLQAFLDLAEEPEGLWRSAEERDETVEEDETVETMEESAGEPREGEADEDEAVVEEWEGRGTGRGDESLGSDQAGRGKRRRSEGSQGPASQPPPQRPRDADAAADDSDASLADFEEFERQAAKGAE